MEFIACALRNTDGTFSTISNAAHGPVGISSVETFTDYIKVNFNKTYAKVGTMSVTVDETFALKGYIAGASVGLSYMLIYVSAPGATGPRKLLMSELESTYGNLWVNGLMIP